MNEGFAGACNRGARAVKNDIVVFLNNDMRVEENFLPALLENSLILCSLPLPLRSSSQTRRECAKKRA